MIGKARVSHKSNKFAFTLVANSVTYTFDNHSESSEVSSVYQFVKETSDDWYIIIYKSGSITFSSLNTTLDICGVGGGGGGGGGRAFGSGYGGSGKYGGSGGGGYYSEVLNTMLSKNVEYTTTIGAGGGGGGGGYSSGTSGTGTTGGTTSITANDTTILSAAGGGGGHGASSASYTAGDGSGGSTKYCFDGTTDNGFPKVSGGGGPGSGGGGGSYNSNLYGDWSANRGGSGKAGIIVIRTNRNAALLSVTAPAHSIVTVSKGTVSQQSAGVPSTTDSSIYYYYFKVKEFDSEVPQTVTATRGTESSTTEIFISSAMSYSLTLVYPKYLFKAGDGPQQILGIRLQSTNVGAEINNNMISQYFTTTSTGSTVAAIHAVDSIDVTNYKYLVFDSLLIQNNSSADYKVMYLVSTNLNNIALTGKASTVNQTAKFIPSDTTERRIDVIDISSVSGNYYIGTWGSGEFQIYNIYLTNDLPEGIT